MFTFCQSVAPPGGSRWGGDVGGPPLVILEHDKKIRDYFFHTDDAAPQKQGRHQSLEISELQNSFEKNCV